MRKWLAITLLLFLGDDIALDSALADCHASATVPACHTCVCQTHMANPPTTAPMGSLASAADRMLNTEPQVAQRLRDKSLFHPPKVLA